MKRQGFVMPVVISLLILAMCAVGFMAERSSLKLKAEFDRLREKSASDLSYIGMKHAEDWLISSVLSDGMPMARTYSSDPDPLKRIEAVQRGGRPIEDMASGAFLVKLYVADTDYAEGLFTAKSLKDRPDTPFIPRLPFEEVDGVQRRYYYIRSAASEQNGPSAVYEELLAVSLNIHTRTVSVERLFYKGAANSR